MTELTIENVQEYPRPPRLEPVGVRLRVELGGMIVAETVAGLRVLETHHAPTYYFPPGDVAEGVLRTISNRSLCEWKGSASYFDVCAGGVEARQAAWAYPRPNPGFRRLQDHVAFYAGQMDGCFVGDLRVMAQPGSFYGGWVTSNLTGIVKGAPGTEGW